MKCAELLLTECPTALPTDVEPKSTSALTLTPHTPTTPYWLRVSAD